MREVFHFFRYASNQELENLFGTFDFDEIFNENPESYIIQTILDYVLS